MAPQSLSLAGHHASISAAPRPPGARRPSRAVGAVRWAAGGRREPSLAVRRAAAGRREPSQAVRRAARARYVGWTAARPLCCASTAPFVGWRPRVGRSGRICCPVGRR